MRFIPRFAAGTAALLATWLCLAGTAKGQAVSALPSVDLNRFAGNWYEIARLPEKREKGCIANVVDVIALDDKKDHLQLVLTCKAKSDYTDVSNASIKAEKDSGGTKLKVTYIWPFSDKEWILALGADYEWVLIGNPNHKMLKVLSRTRSMSPEVLAEIKLKATSQGYPADKLMMTLQTKR